MDTTTYVTLKVTKHVLHVLEKVQAGHLAEVWTETWDYQDHQDQDRLDLETPQDFLRRVAGAEPGTIENGNEYIVLEDRVVQEENGTHIFHTLTAERWMAVLSLDIKRT